MVYNYEDFILNEGFWDFLEKQEKIHEFKAFTEPERKIITVFLCAGDDPNFSNDKKTVSHKFYDEEDNKEITVVLSKINLDGKGFVYHAYIKKGTSMKEVKHNKNCKEDDESFNTMMLKNFIMSLQKYY